MKPNETQPELVWYNGRWLLKSVVDRVIAEREAEKAEAKRVLMANVEGWRAATRVAKALEKAEKEKAPVSGPANPPSQAQAPESPKPGLSDPIKVEATSVAEEERGEAILSDQIKPNAEEAKQKSGEATPGNAGILAGRGGGRDSWGSEGGRAEKVHGGSGGRPVGVADRTPEVPIAPTQSILSDQIKANAEMAEQESGEATRQSDPHSLRSRLRRAPAWQAGVASQLKANALSRSRKGKISGLPEEIREALNERLENGEEGKALLDWLNGLPEVKSHLAAEYEGAPILEQNLSAWRKGGYADWLERNALVEVGLRLRENVAEWEEEAGDLDLLPVLSYWLTGQYALATRKMGDLQGHEKWAQLWRIGLGLLRLRQVQEQGEKLKLAEARFAWKQEREEKRAEERAIVLALRKEEKAKRPRRREPTEEETEEAAQECREIFKPETEEDRAYYYKLRRDAEIADALARGEEPPPEEQPEEPSWTHVTKGRYF